MNCEACWHLWSVHGPSGCHAKVYPAHSLSGERCPCTQMPPRRDQEETTREPQEG